MKRWERLDRWVFEALNKFLLVVVVLVMLFAIVGGLYIAIAAVCDAAKQSAELR